MEITKHIPELLPIDGHRMRFHYGGIPKQCLNCYHYGHIKADCKNECVAWIDYVDWFVTKSNMREVEITDKMLGKWLTILKRKMIENEKKDGQKEILGFLSTVRQSSNILESSPNKQNSTPETSEDEDDNTTVAQLAAKFYKTTETLTDVKTKNKKDNDTSSKPPPTTRSKGKMKAT